MEFVSAIEAVAIEGGWGPLGVVDEKHSGFNVVFLAQFPQEEFGETDRIRAKEPDMKGYVRFRIEGGIRPVLLIVDASHGFIERNVIRARTAVGP